MFLRPRLEECVLYHVSKKLSLYPSHHFPYIKGCIWFGLLVLLTQTSHHSKYNLFVHCHLIQWSLHLLNVAFIIFMLANDHFEPPYTSFSGLLMMFEEAQAGIISSHTVDIFSKIQIVSWIHAQYRITAVKIKSAKLSVLRPWLWHWTHQYCSYRRKVPVFLQREPYFSQNIPHLWEMAASLVDVLDVFFSFTSEVFDVFTFGFVCAAAVRSDKCCSGVLGLSRHADTRAGQAAEKSCPCRDNRPFLWANNALCWLYDVRGYRLHSDRLTVGICPVLEVLCKARSVWL